MSGEHVVCRQGTSDTFERKLADWLNGHGIFDLRQHSGANQDLTGLGFVAQSRCDVGHRPNGGIVESPSKPIVPSVANPWASGLFWPG